MAGIEGIELRLARIDEGVARLLELREQVRQEWLSIQQAAVVTGLSASHVRRAVRRSELAASNAGTKGHPIWRIARVDLDAWMRRRMGGVERPPIAGTVTVTRKSRHFDD